jgi:hypothetical protein
MGPTLYVWHLVTFLFLFAFLPFSLLLILYALLHGHNRIAPPPSEPAMSQLTVAEEATPSLD